MLQKEREEMTRNLEELALRRVHLEKRSEALDNQLRENNQNIQALTSDKNSCLTSLKETGDERDDLRTKLTENDEQLKELQRELEANNQQLDEKYEQVRIAEQNLIQLQNQNRELLQYRDVNTDLQQTVQTLSAEKEQCYNAYRLLESKQQQALQVNQAIPQANLPAVPQHTKLSPDLQQQQQQLMQNGIPPGQIGGQINMAPQVPGNIQVPGVPNVPLYMKQVPSLQAGGDKVFGRVPQLPDMQLNRLPVPVPGDKRTPSDLDNGESEGEDEVKMGEKSEIGDEKNIDQQDVQLKQSENNGDSKPMVHVDPGMVNQLDGDDVRGDSAQQVPDRKELEDGEDKGDAPSADLKDEKEISENVVDGGLSNMDSESDNGDQGDPDKAIENNGPSDADEFDSEKERGGLQIDRANIEKEDDDEEQGDDKLRFEGHEIQNQLNPAPINI